MKYKLVLEQMEDGCIIPTSHALNQDGYFRKMVDGKLWMYHRYVWTQEVGEIPEGYEIDHLCKNRACCNINHLQLLKSSVHRSKDNSERYEEKFRDRKEEAYNHWKETSATMKELIAKYEIHRSTGRQWIIDFEQRYIDEPV